MMKYVIVLAAIFATVAAVDKDFLEKIVKMAEDCSKEVSATEADIQELMEHKIPSSHEGKCVISCVHKKLGLQNADGKIDLEGSLSAIEPLKEKDAEIYEKAKQVFEKCSEQVTEDDDECITGANMMECGKKVGNELGLTKEMFQI